MTLRLALDSELAVLASAGRGDPRTGAAVLRFAEQGPIWKDLTTFLESHQTGGRPLPIDVVLLPPLADGRLASPQHGERSPGPASSPLVDALGPVVETSMALDEGAGRADSLRYVGSCAAQTLGDLMRALSAAGHEINSVTLADSSWAAAAAEVTRAAEPSICVVQGTGPRGSIRLILVVDGAPVALRRLPTEASRQAVAECIGSLRGRLVAIRERPAAVLPLGDSAFRQFVEEAASMDDCDVIVATGLIAGLDHDPVAVAAAFAGTGPRLVPPEVISDAKARTRRRGHVAAAAAVGLLAIAGLLDTLDLRSEIDAVRAARAPIAMDVSEALAVRERVARLSSTLSALEELRHTAPRWTAALTLLSDVLPESAHVRSLRAVGDSVYLELEGPDAASAVDALREIPWWTGLRAATPIERDVGDGSRITERLTVAALVDWPSFNDSRDQSP